MKNKIKKIKDKVWQVDVFLTAIMALPDMPETAVMALGSCIHLLDEAQEQIDDIDVSD